MLLTSSRCSRRNLGDQEAARKEIDMGGNAPVVAAAALHERGEAERRCGVLRELGPAFYRAKGE
jgi:hypothetical protein